MTPFERFEEIAEDIADPAVQHGARYAVVAKQIYDALCTAHREAYEQFAKLFDYDGWLELVRNGTLPNDVITPRTVAQMIRRLAEGE